MTIVPVLSMKPHLSLTRTGARPSLNLHASSNCGRITIFPDESMYPCLLFISMGNNADAEGVWALHGKEVSAKITIKRRSRMIAFLTTSTMVENISIDHCRLHVF